MAAIRCINNSCYLVLSMLLLGISCVQGQTPQPPTGIQITGYESHIELSWSASTSANISGYQIYRSTDSLNFTLLKTVGSTITAATDWIGDEGQNQQRWYQIKTAAAAGGQTSDFSPAAGAATHPMDDEALLEMVQKQTFRYFWEHAHPESGMARERTGSGQTVTTGGSGFGIMSIIVAAERGWITREAAVNRMLQIVSFLQVADRFHGVYPHWMDGTTGNVIPFSQYDDGADLVETAFLMQGLLAARQYYNQNTPVETALRDVITGIWEDVEWDWFRKNNSNVLYWHWSPNYGWQMNFALRGFNEAQIVYILAAASPTHSIPASLYQSGWTSSGYANNSIHYGRKVFCGPFGGGPMFFAHYSYMGFDPRPVKDAFCNYYVRHRNHALIQQTYSATNPENHTGYSGDCWGLTACDGPNGYSAHDIYPGNDDGTIAPTAALASMPYTPDESKAALRHFYRVLGERLWGQYGFYDAFNEDQDWFASSYLAIDQGPIIVMIENYRTGLLWDLFMQNTEIQPALYAIGFVPDNSDTEELLIQKNGFDAIVSPNPLPVKGTLTIELSILKNQELSAAIIDLQGHAVQVLIPQRKMTTGVYSEVFAVKKIPAGTYLLEIKNIVGTRWTKQLVIL